MVEDLHVGPDDVLVLRALGLGDALTGVAALRGVRRAWPGRRVVLAAPAATAGWLRTLGLADAVVHADGVRRPPEALPVVGRGHVAVNLHGRGPRTHEVLRRTGPSNLVAYGSVEAGHDGPAWDAHEHEVDRWCRLVRAAGGDCSREDLRLAPRDGVARRGPVVLHPGAASGSRRWPVERWSELAGRLLGDGHDVVVSGGPDERELAHAVVSRVQVAARGRAHGPESGAVTNAAGRLDLPGLAALVAGARLLVAGDTGVAHVATAYATPSVLLFGPTAPQRWGPAIDRDLHTVLWHGDPARPGDPHAGTIDPALAAITVDEVTAAARAQLARLP